MGSTIVEWEDIKGSCLFALTAKKRFSIQNPFITIAKNTDYGKALIPLSGTRTLSNLWLNVINPLNRDGMARPAVVISQVLNIKYKVNA